MARAAAAPREVKPVLTGPYSLAQGSILEGGYRNRHALARAYAEVLAEEIADLAGAGAGLIQVDEPYFLQHPEDADVVRETFAHAGGGAGLGPAGVLRPTSATPCRSTTTLMALPADVIGLDFTYSPKLAARIAEAGTARTLALGLIDGRNTKLETAAAALPHPRPRAARGSGETAYLNPSCGLEFLPRDRARAKLETMARLWREYAGRKGS